MIIDCLSFTFLTIRIFKDYFFMNNILKSYFSISNKKAFNWKIRKNENKKVLLLWGKKYNQNQIL